MTTRTLKAPEERRSEMIAAAQHLFYTKGYERTSISDIVRAVGVAQGTFYYYFDSKAAVLRAIVDDIVERSWTVINAVVEDDALPALTKWQRLIQATAGWKLEHKEQLTEINRVLAIDENILLRHTLFTETSRMTATELAKIIAQGVDEGVFDVEFIPETADLVMALIFRLGEVLRELILDPERPDDVAARTMTYNSAVQAGVERLLGAPSGSLPIIDEETLHGWLVD